MSLIKINQVIIYIRIVDTDIYSKGTSIKEINNSILRRTTTSFHKNDATKQIFPNLEENDILKISQRIDSSENNV